MANPPIAAKALLAAVLMFGSTAPVLAREVPGMPSLEAAAVLAPSDFIWNDVGPDAGDVRVIVSIADQRAYVFRGSAVIAVSAVSTGRAGHETPSGAFPILQKRVTHRSNIYSNAPMPFMQRLTWDGIALHAGHNPGYAASHGCVRLPMAFAKKLFAVTQIGAEVLITGDPIELVAPIVEPSLPRVQPIPVIRQTEPPVPRMILARATISNDGDAAAIRAALASVRRSSGAASVDAMVALVY